MVVHLGGFVVLRFVIDDQERGGFVVHLGDVLEMSRWQAWSSW